MNAQKKPYALPNLTVLVFGSGGRVTGMKLGKPAGFSNNGKAISVKVEGYTRYGRKRSEVVRLRSSPQAKQSWLIQKTLWHSGVAVPEPLGYSGTMQTFMYREAPGELYRTIIEGRKVSKKELTNMFRAAALWLKKVSAKRIRVAWLPRLKRTAWYMRLKKDKPTMPPDWRACWRDLHVRQPKVERPGFVHGDFQASNLIWHKKKVAVIDFTESFFGDPLWDVGYFLAHSEHMVEYHYGAVVWKWLQSKVLSSYFGRSPTAEERHRLAWAYAVTHMMIAVLLKDQCGQKAHYERTVRRAQQALSGHPPF